MGRLVGRRANHSLTAQAVAMRARPRRFRAACRPRVYCPRINWTGEVVSSCRPQRRHPALARPTNPRNPAEPHDSICPSVSWTDRKSTRLNSSHLVISYAVFCLETNKGGMQRIHHVVNGLDGEGEGLCSHPVQVISDFFKVGGTTEFNVLALQDALPN